MKKKNSFYLCAHTRSSAFPTKKLAQKMNEAGILKHSPDDADAVLAAGDRWEVFDHCKNLFRSGYPIVHLWAGEVSQGTQDEVWRHSITLMADLALCTNKRAQRRVQELCYAVDKEIETWVVGNLMLDDLETFDKLGKSAKKQYSGYDLVLYNSPTSLSTEEIEGEIDQIFDLLGVEKGKLKSSKQGVIWIESNKDPGGQTLIDQYSNMKTVNRGAFLGLIKHCDRFITNSSSAYYEAPFLIDEDQIIIIGERNKDRESGHARMDIPDATQNVLDALDWFSKNVL